ncbi:ComE operon protein 2 [compost metagenome]
MLRMAGDALAGDLNMADWDRRFMEMATFVGSWSKDRSTKVGCVIVGPSNEVRSVGYNGFVRGMDDTDEAKHLRPAKYSWTEHAERNAIYQAAMNGIALNGCRMYLPWFPCMDCARAIVQSGIKELIVVKPDLLDQRWGADFTSAIEMFVATGILVRYFPLDQASKTLQSS